MTPFIEVSIEQQTLKLIQSDSKQTTWTISTALNGPGEIKDSGCTPRGTHIIRALIGHDLPLNTVLVGRRPTGELYTPDLGKSYPERDWILTRILWLSGVSKSENRLGNVDTFQRYIYIHGTPDSEPMGIPLSHGCIRMRNSDLTVLFEQCFYKMKVFIS